MKEEKEKQCTLYEINLMKKLDHPKIVKMIELYEGENNIYCVSEYFKGQDLLNVLLQNGIPTE